MNNLAFNPAPPRVHRKRKQRATSSPVSALVLIAAAYEPGAYVELTFDRAIDIAGFVPSTVLVSDGDVMGFFYQGSDESFLMGPTTLRVMLVGIEEGAPSGVTMTAGASNGIVASDDAAAWAGASDVTLPFG